MSTTYGEKEYSEWLADPVFKPAPPTLFPELLIKSYSPRVDSPGNGENVDPRQSGKCDACLEMFKSYGENTLLPPTDCFQGDGLGVWMDNFFDPSGGIYWGASDVLTGFNPDGTYRGGVLESTIIRQKRDYWLSLFENIGVSNFFPGSSERNDIQVYSDIANTSSVGGEIIWPRGTPFMFDVKYSYTDPNTGKVKDLEGKEINTNWLPFDVSEVGLNNAPYYQSRIDAYYIDEPFELIFDKSNILLQLHQDLVDSNNQSTNKLTDDELKDVIIGERMDVFADILYNNRQSLPRGGKPLVFSGYSEYTFEGMRQLLSNARFLKLFQDGNVRFYPDMYSSNFSFRKRQKFYSRLLGLYNEHNINPRLIRPFITTSCDPCSGDDKQLDECVNGASIICDMMQIRSLGFGGPYLYMSGGIDKKAFAGMILGSWLMGCIESSDCALERPRTYGSLQKMICRLFLSRDIESESLEEFMKCFPIYRNSSNILENPAICKPCCRLNGRLYGIGINQCKSRPCCHDVLDCTQKMVDDNLLDPIIG